MTLPLVEIALSYVKAANANFSDEDGKEEIKNAFQEFLSGNISREPVAEVLEKHIGTINPLERIEAILSMSDTPLSSNGNGDGSFDGISAIRKKTRPWSTVEDMRLLAGVHRYGLDNWILVSKFVGNGRTRAQCAQRWCRGLDPKICKEQWSPEEEQKLLTLLRTYKNRGWTNVAAGMGNRSDVQCRYHFLQMQRDGKLNGEFQDLVIHDKSLHPVPLPTKMPKPMRIRQATPPNFNNFNTPLSLNRSTPIFSMSMQNQQIPLQSSPQTQSLSNFSQGPVAARRKRTSSQIAFAPPPPILPNQQQSAPSMDFDSDDAFSFDSSIPSYDFSMNSPMNNQMNSPMNNQMNNSMGNPMNNQINNQMNNQMNNSMGNSMNNQMNSQMNNQMNSQMNNQMNSQMNNQMNSQMNNPMGNHLSNPMSIPLSNPMGIPLNSGIGNSMNGQLSNPMSMPMSTPLRQQMSEQISPQISPQVSNDVPSFQQSFSPQQHITQSFSPHQPPLPQSYSPQQPAIPTLFPQPQMQTFSSQISPIPSQQFMQQQQPFQQNQPNTQQSFYSQQQKQNDIFKDDVFNQDANSEISQQQSEKFQPQQPPDDIFANPPDQGQNDQNDMFDIFGDRIRDFDTGLW
ncbi:hypothetical protein TRFO_23799 [Tritrichomonas foetus]|uniref:Myb-like DNA-binding domain containing protein n=1 Tax=Tritrichomonas foetus TaxID=1144522 RepID=A0A1J4KDR2_9EUKA|nr:hypothetical protein TRFO_23799 [Tritrichomonas foetus]|eukprot:OHT07852.1 hypothetical protein TRFO_23799 [Tritrichomonas foetus]